MREIEHVAYERNPELGGTWLENRYAFACHLAR
jgi:cation diffusion facilitator CzcD-associated flavoprotein CzcO